MHNIRCATWGLTRQVALTLFGAAFMSAAFAAPHKQIDLRSQTDADGEYSISLCTRPSPTPGGIPGHAFVAYSYLPAATKNRQFVALGFTTDSTVKGVLSYKGVFAEPSGFLDEEKFTHVREQCLVLLVSKEDFERAYAQSHPFAKLPAFKDVKYAANYKLAENDCVTFMSTVATGFIQKGIKVPARRGTEFPATYLRRIIEAN